MKHDEKDGGGVERHTVSLPAELSEWADQARGDVSFSRFVVRAIEQFRDHKMGKSPLPSELDATSAQADLASGLTPMLRVAEATGAYVAPKKRPRRSSRAQRQEPSAR